ncbi:MAG: DUF4332 domain-containing protein [Candidatus Thermoplasmatota archaeon]
MAGSKGVIATLLFLILLVLGAAAAAVVIDHDDLNTLDLSENAYMATLAILVVAMVIALVALIILLASRRPLEASGDTSFVPLDGSSDSAATEAPAFSVDEADPAPQQFAQGPKVTVYDLPSLQPAYRSFSREQGGATYTYPREVSKAIYSNDHLDVGGGNHLKVRTLVAGPEDPGPIPAEQIAPLPVELGPDDVPQPYRSKLFAPGAVSPTGKPADGEAFVAQLAKARTAAKPKAVRVPTYYGYPGDVHPVEDIEGIGAIYGEKLRKAGVFTTDRLNYENAQELADKVGVPRGTVDTWQAMAELVKVKGVGPQYAEAMARAGLGGIADLKRRSAERISEQVTSYLESLNATVVGNAVTPKRVESWQKAAAKMTRVRLQVPAQ